MSDTQSSVSAGASSPDVIQRLPRATGILNNDVVLRFRRHRMALFGAVIIIIMTVLAIFAPWIAPYRPEEIDLSASLQGPSGSHFFGADAVGRDIFSRILYGARYSLTIGLVAVAVGLAIGLPIGTVSGFRGGWLDVVVMRFVDILFAFPTILLALVIITIFGTGLFNAMLAIGISQMPTYARLMRGVVLQVRRNDYVEAARAVGGTDRRILVRHVVPNSLAPIIVQSTLQLAAAILAAAYLGFLGLGAKPGTPEWGTMLSDGRNFLAVAPHVTIYPGLTIMLVVLAVNLVGDGLRDALEPRLKR